MEKFYTALILFAFVRRNSMTRSGLTHETRQQKTGGALDGHPRFGFEKKFCRGLSQQVQLSQLDGDIPEGRLQLRAGCGDVGMIFA